MDLESVKHISPLYAMIKFLRGNTTSVRGRFYYRPKEWVKYFFACKLLGKTWIEFYSKRMNAFFKDVDGIQVKSYGEKGRLQLDFVKALGLKTHHRFLEIGCGSGRAAVHFVDFLDEGRYVGLDITGERIRIAWNLIDRRQLRHKRPELICNRDCKLKELEGRTFDFIYGYSVITHMPLKDIRTLFSRLRELMHAHSVGYFTFSAAGAGVKRVSVKDWLQSPEVLIEACERAGLKGEVDDGLLVHHPEGEALGNTKVLRVTLKGRMGA